MVPLLVLHGFTGCGEAMAPLTDHLDGPVLAPNLPGHGSDWKEDANEPWGIEETARDLLARMESRPLIDVLGYSMGGRVALAMAAEAPDRVRSLTLVSASAGIADPALRDERRVEDFALAARIREKGIQWFIDHWSSQPMWASQEKLTGSVRMAQRWLKLSNSAEGLARSLEQAGQGAMRPLFDELPKLDLPVDLIVGELDPKYQHIARELADLLPEPSLRVMKGAGHAVHLESAEELARIVNLSREML